MLLPQSSLSCLDIIVSQFGITPFEILWIRLLRDVLATLLVHDSFSFVKLKEAVYFSKA